MIANKVSFKKERKKKTVRESIFEVHKTGGVIQELISNYSNFIQITHILTSSE